MNQIILFQRGISLNNFRPIKILFSLFNSWNIIFTFKSILTKLKKYFWNLKYFFEMFNTFKFCMIESKRSDRIIIRWKIWNKCKKITLKWMMKQNRANNLQRDRFPSIYDLVFHYSNLLDRDSTDPLFYHWHLRIIIHLHIYIHFDCTYISLRISSRSSFNY